jgi:hypothetical protein
MTKKSIIAIAALVVTFGSCTKLSLNGNHGDKTKKTTIVSEETLTVKAGETITFALPTELAHDGYAVINQSTVAPNSSIVDYTTYSYTAPTVLPVGFTTDEIMVSNDHHAYSSIGHNEIPGTTVDGYPQHYTVNFHVTIAGAINKK